MKYVLLELLGGLLLAAGGLFGFALWQTGDWGVVDVPPSHVAVKVDHLSGSTAVVEGPGFVFHLPFVQDVELLDRRPKTFRMEGEADQGVEHERYLTVRARDGSSFWFESMELTYRLLPGAAGDVLADSGAGVGFRTWLGAYARGVLSDEFGRYAAQDAANQSETKGAKEEARRRLNELLAPHGVEVVQITTPKPKFDRDYEKAIYDRKIANQEVEKLGAQIEQLREERGQRLAKIEKEKKIEEEALRGKLEEERIAAETQAIQTRGKADAYATERAIEGASRRAQMLAEAELKSLRAQREAEGLRAMVAAVSGAGDAAVREAFVERLADVVFRLAPPPKEPGVLALTAANLGGEL